MIQRVYEQCNSCNKLTDVIVATDDNRILNHVLEFGGKAIITSKDHETGTERCNEIAENLTTQFDIIVNIQGDEPYINPLQIDEVIHLFNNPETQIATLAKEINTVESIKNKNTTKVMFDKERNAIKFSREFSNISSKETYYKHIGIYAYKKEILKKICQLPKSKNEIKEQLEQLRWLDNNYKIKIGITNFETLSVDTAEDIEEIKRKIR